MAEAGQAAHPMGGREGGGGRRKRHYAVAGAALGCIVLGLSCVALMHGEDAPTVLRGVTTEGRKLFPKMQLWESADSPNHDPYYNIFDYHKDLKRGNRGGHVEDENAHKTWSPNEIRERVWQMMKDVRSMERHVKEQNVLNKGLTDEVAGMKQQADKEKEIVHMLISKGMDGIRDKVELLRDAVNTNVTGVRDALGHLDSSISDKQDEQDQRLTELERARTRMETDNKEQLGAFERRVSGAEKDLEEAKANVKQQREKIKELIYARIQDDIGNLDDEMDKRFTDETSDVRALIREGMQYLDANVTHFSLTTGVDISHLVSKVNSLSKKQGNAEVRQDAEITKVEEEHKDFYNKTISRLEKLRDRVESNRVTLTKAQEILDREEKARVQGAEPYLRKLAREVPALKSALMPQLHERERRKALLGGEGGQGGGGRGRG